MRTKRLLFGIAALLACSIFANGQATNPAPTPSPTPTPTPTPTLPALDRVMVLEAYGQDRVNNPQLKEKHSAGLQDVIIIRVRDLESLIRASKCLSKDDHPVPNCQPQAIALFLDGRHIKGIVPESGAPRFDPPLKPGEPWDGTLQFHLLRHAESDEAWADLLGAPPLGPGFFKKPTEVSVGLENAFPLSTEVKPASADQKRRFSLIRIHFEWFVICAILLLLILFFLLALARYSDVLRDVGPRPAPPPVISDGNRFQRWLQRLREQQHKPYSLGRFQMAVWFFLVIFSFLFIWLITGATDTITTSTLALIGIGAGTALGAAAIDIVSQPVTATGAPTDGAPPANPPAESKGFLTDILTDGQSGVSFHRFQMFVWTFVLGVLFIYSVWNRLSMPEFSATLLALMGISSGTYLGFKIPEKQN